MQIASFRQRVCLESGEDDRGAVAYFGDFRPDLCCGWHGEGATQKFSCVGIAVHGTSSEYDCMGAVHG